MPVIHGRVPLLELQNRTKDPNIDYVIDPLKTLKYQYIFFFTNQILKIDSTYI